MGHYITSDYKLLYLVVAGTGSCAGRHIWILPENSNGTIADKTLIEFLQNGIIMLSMR